MPTKNRTDYITDVFNALPHIEGFTYTTKELWDLFDIATADKGINLRKIPQKKDTYADEENKPVANINKLITKYGTSSSWCHRLVNTENNSATLLGQMPGEGNRLHYHPNWNEWWYIVNGMWEWDIEGKKTIIKKGEVVFIRKGSKHKITAIGDEMAIRLAVSREDVEHIYPVESS